MNRRAIVNAVIAEALLLTAIALLWQVLAS